MPFTTMVASDMSHRTEPSVTLAGSQFRQDDQSTTSKPAKAKTSYITRLQNARPRILLLVACIVYLSSAIVAVNTGLLNISNFIYPRFDRAVAELQGQKTTLYTERILYGRLHKLLSSQLSRGFMETHEDCLIRGLEKANNELLGLGLQYTDMRIQVMDWTMDNCGKLQYTPQVVVQDPTPQQAVLTYWADASYRSRRMVEKALDVMQQQARWIWNRPLGAVLAPNASTLTKHVSASANTSETPSSNGSLPKVPFGFALRCEPSRPCRLIPPPVSSLYSYKVSTSSEALAKFERRARELYAFNDNLNRGLSATWRLVYTLDFVNNLLLATLFVTLVGASMYKNTVRVVRAPEKMNEEEKHAIKVIGICFFLRLVHALFTIYPKRLPCDDLMALSGLPYDVLKVLFGLFMLLIGVTTLLEFFIVPSSELKDIAQVYGLIKELYLIARGREVLDKEDTKRKPSPGIGMDAEIPRPKATEDLPTGTETDSSQFDHRQQRNQSPKPHHRLASPITSIGEDIKAYVKAFREEPKPQQTVQSDVDSDIDTETDTESDTEPYTEDSGFVDLAGGVTPQLTDAESGWSMVDA